MATTLSALIVILCGASPGEEGILQDSSYYSGITERINDSVETIAGGIRMPDGITSPPLPELFDTDTVSTATDAAFKSLPSDYQRGIFMVADSNGDQIRGPRGGGYYSFAMFMREVGSKDLSEAGSIWVVCVRGTNLYYQGIPSTSVDLTVHFYRAPVAMNGDSVAPDGIPGHLQKRLIQHYVAKEVFAEIEIGVDGGGKNVEYHTAKFFEAMTDLIDFIGIDAEPEFFGSDDDD